MKGSNPASLAKQEWGKMHKLFWGTKIKKIKIKIPSFTEPLPGGFTVEDLLDSKVAFWPIDLHTSHPAPY